MKTNSLVFILTQKARVPIVNNLPEKCEVKDTVWWHIGGKLKLHPFIEKTEEKLYLRDFKSKFWLNKYEQ